MELLFSMRRKPLKCEPPQYEGVNDTEVVRPICTISTANIIAFSSPTELDDSEGDTWGGHVYVCDLDTPWDSHKVTSTAYPVSALEWDGEGKKLLVATTVGEVSVFMQKDYLLNEWTCHYSATFPGENIIRGIFFDNGRRIVALDKKTDIPITDKYQMLRPTPTLKGFGGVPCEGVCVVSGTGLVGAATPGGQAGGRGGGGLRGARQHVTAAAMAHKNGNILIAVSCGACVRCFVCVVSRAAGGCVGGVGGAGGGGAPSLVLQPLPAVQPPQSDLLAPVSLAWCLRDDTDYLLVASNTLTLWKCSERAHPVHKLFSKGPVQGSTTPGGGQKPASDCFNTVVWQRCGGWSLEGPPAVWACGGRGGPGLAAVASHRSLHLLPRDTHHYLVSKAVVPLGPPEEAPAGTTPPKKTKYGPSQPPSGVCGAVSCVCVSASGAVVVCVDRRARLAVYSVHSALPWADIPTPITVPQAVSLLETCLVSGHDCLDVLLTLKHNIIEAVYERVTESFLRQPPSFQQYYYHAWLKIRIALCRLSASSQSTASTLTCVQMCHAVWGGCAGSLRPEDRPDLPLPPLPTALLDDTHPEHDKSVSALESKPELISELVSAAPLRTYLQRGLDTALSALLAFSSQGQPHSDIWCAPGVVSLLRKLVILVRAAGVGGAAGGGGGGATGTGRGESLSRVLARLATAPVPKHDLIEECSSVSLSWGPRGVWEAPPRCALSSPHSLAPPLYFEYGVEPEALRYTPEPPAYTQCDTTPSLAMDSIRYMYLGGGSRPARWRQCGRCGARALPAAQPSRHPLQKAYDGRFLEACRCGGKWTLFSNV